MTNESTGLEDNTKWFLEQNLNTSLEVTEEMVAKAITNAMCEYLPANKAQAYLHAANLAMALADKLQGSDISIIASVEFARH